jgi:hypothetical protein
MADLLAAYLAWSEAPFPPGSHRDDLNDLYGDLHVVDEWILSTVYPFAEHGTIVPVRVDIEAGLRDLRSRLVGLRSELSGDDALLADQYLAYVGALDAVYSAFRSETAAQ